MYPQHVKASIFITYFYASYFSTQVYQKNTSTKQGQWQEHILFNFEKTKCIIFNEFIRINKTAAQTVCTI